MNRKVSIAAVGDVNDINTWSNIPYFFYKTGNQQRVFHHAWNLQLDQFKWARIAWNMKQILFLKGKGGYQFSHDFLDKAESQIPENYFKTNIISFNQVFPRSSTVIQLGGEIYRYIDATLYDLMKEPSYQLSFSSKEKDRILELERENYQDSVKVVTMASWVQKSLKEFYGLPQNKIRTILPGANIELPETDQKITKADDFFTLGFIGKDWERKGLPLVVELAEWLKQSGKKVKVKVIGQCPDHLAEKAVVDYLGFIDKHQETERFIDEVRNCDLGCFFSLSEAMGIAPLEFIRLGIPVTGFAYQGLNDALIPECSIRFNSNDQKEKIFRRLNDIIVNHQAFSELKKSARSFSDYVSWERCIENWKVMLNE